MENVLQNNISKRFVLGGRILGFYTGIAKRRLYESSYGVNQEKESKLHMRSLLFLNSVALMYAIISPESIPSITNDMRARDSIQSTREQTSERFSVLCQGVGAPDSTAELVLCRGQRCQVHQESYRHQLFCAIFV